MADEKLSPRELDELANFYDSHDTSGEMEEGRWVDPTSINACWGYSESGETSAGGEGFSWSFIIDNKAEYDE